MTEVVYACNEGYIRQTILSVVSLLKYHPSVKINLIADHISEEKMSFFLRKVSAYTEVINIIPLGRVLGKLDLPKQDRHPQTIYAKLFLDEVLQCDKALYLDSDVIVSGSLDELLKRDMTGELAAGVIMPYPDSVKERLGLAPNDCYICDGMVLLNLEQWRTRKISRQCRRYIANCRGTPCMQSEGVLNYVCRGKIGVLAPAYNLMPSMIFFTRDQIIRMQHPAWYYSKKQLLDAKHAPKMIHFMAELYNRPWLEPCDHPYATCYRELDRQVFGNRHTYQRANVSFRTRVNKWLYRALPFKYYILIYKVSRRRPA